MIEFVKRNPGSPKGFFACEAAGLDWLSMAGGVPCAKVLGYDDSSVTLERLDEIDPNLELARAFGRQLAVTHDAGATGFGAGPPGWGGPGFFGPMHHPMSMSLTVHDSWGQFYAEERLMPMLIRAIDYLDRSASVAVQRVIKRCSSGDFDGNDVPARIHGDLWSGNIVWTSQGATLIDPAAHGGHRESDLAMLALFGAPHLEVIYAGYEATRRLEPGWRGRIGLHQLYPLLAHVVLFGGSYAEQTERAARSALEIS